MTLSKPLSVAETAAAAGRGKQRVRDAANSGALKCLPRVDGGRFQFTEDAVAEWIAAGSPDMPPRRRRGRAA